MASTKLSRTAGTPTSSKKFTISFWVKRSNIGSAGNGHIFDTYVDSSNRSQIHFDDDNVIDFRLAVSGSNIGRLKTNRVFRDVGAFYHIVASVDTTLATADDRVKLYINGVQETSFSSRINPSQNADFPMNGTHTIGAYGGGTNYFDGTLSYFAFVDGTAYTPTSFGETNAASGIWKINTAPSVTYGNNGFFLKMDTTSPGSDTSGNDNTFTAAGTPTLAQDNASNNLVTMNPLDNYFPSFTFSNGKTTVATGGNYSYPQATIYVNKGKWYWECKPISKASGQDEYMIGVQGKSATAVNQPAQSNNGITIYGRDGDTYGFGGGGTDYAASYTAGDIIGVALDCDNNKIYWSKNGAWSNGSGAWDSATFNAAVGDKAITDPNDVPQGGYSPVAGFYDSPVAVLSFNFGNGFFGTTAVASSNADAAGHGLFEYAVPTGFFTLNTKNLNTYG